MHPADGQMNGLYVSIAVCNRMVTDIVGPNGPFRRWVNGDEWSGLRLKIQKHLLRMQELVLQDVWEGVEKRSWLRSDVSVLGGMFRKVLLDGWVFY